MDNKEKGIQAESQENTDKMETLPPAPVKLADQRKNPPGKLKEINPSVNDKKVTIVAKGLEEEFELPLVAFFFFIRNKLILRMNRSTR